MSDQKPSPIRDLDKIVAEGIDRYVTSQDGSFRIPDCVEYLLGEYESVIQGHSEELMRRALARIVRDKMKRQMKQANDICQMKFGFAPQMAFAIGNGLWKPYRELNQADVLASRNIRTDSISNDQRSLDEYDRHFDRFKSFWAVNPNGKIGECLDHTSTDELSA